MENKKINIGISDIILLVLSAVFLIGIRTFFAPCGPKDDGSWMTCHWAEQVVFVIGIVLTVISLVILIAGNSKIAAGASIAAVPVAISAALIPGFAVNLCMMTNMHCHTVMRAAVIVVSALIVVLAAANAFLTARNKGGADK